MPGLNLFIPITKVDVAQRLVYGVATAEAEDRAGEVCDYASTKPYYQAWSGAIHKSTGGKSRGNVRAMHGKVAAGKVTEIHFDDAGKRIEVCAKVVDDDEWKKVEEGVYTGFSQGGSYVKRWKDEAGKQRYTADPHEISLVDLPCLPSATFEVIKSDGGHEARRFATVIAEPGNDDVARKATELAKAAGDGAKWTDHIDAARAELMKAALPAVEVAVADDPRPVDKPTDKSAPVAQSTATPPEGDEWEQVWKSKRDGATFRTKAELRKHHEALDATAVVQAATAPALDALAGIEAALGKREDVTAAPQPRLKLVAPDLAKSLYIAASFAEILASLRAIAASTAYDSMFSQDGATSAFAAQMKAWVAQGCAMLVSIIQDEIDGLADADALVIEAAAGLRPDAVAALVKFAQDRPASAALSVALTKAGRRNSGKDQASIQVAHDKLVEAGATCAGGADKARGGADLAKAADDLAKVTAERDAFRKAFDDLGPQLAEVLKVVKTIEAQPMPVPIARVVTKEQDTGGQSGAEALAEMAKNPDAMALALIKASQSQGQPLFRR